MKKYPALCAFRVHGKHDESLLFYSFILSLFYSFSIEHTTLPLVAPRSTDWASRPLDTNVLKINNLYAMNVGKLLKKRR